MARIFGLEISTDEEDSLLAISSPVKKQLLEDGIYAFVMPYRSLVGDELIVLGPREGTPDREKHWWLFGKPLVVT